MNIASIIRFVGAAALAFAASASFAREVPFTQAAFDKAVAAGQPVIVDVQASWCPTCKAQKPIVDGLLQEPKMKNVTLFSANFDTEAALKQRLRVAQQSTFIVFKGGKEVGRSTGDTHKDSIAALFDKAL
ncbi:MAG: thioredoxin family protein [Pseudomonadota bacterium]|nr:thioredoxin family protein [Pseudomonadota bacterium]